MKSRVIALLCILVVSILSCKAPLHVKSSDPRESQLVESSRILFLDYEVTRDSTKNNYHVQLINKIIKNGSVKKDLHRSYQEKKDDLELLVMDNNHQTINQQYIPNPLDRSVEYVNDAGQFERKMIHLDRAQFSVRLQIEPGAAYIQLNRFTGNDMEGTLLLKTKIK